MVEPDPVPMLHILGSFWQDLDLAVDHHGRGHGARCCQGVSLFYLFLVYACHVDGYPLACIGSACLLAMDLNSPDLYPGFIRIKEHFVINIDRAFHQGACHHAAKSFDSEKPVYKHSGWGIFIPALHLFC